MSDDNAKKYEMISLQHDPLYHVMLKAIPIIKEFIIRKKLIVYGGTAIDYALRLKGDCIYPDDALTIPDLDFYSPDNIRDSAELADILYKEFATDVAAAGGEIRVIRALYVTTMRVDIGNNHFLADITYIPPEVFAKLPTISYEMMNIIHPDYQRVDLHKSLSFPFLNAPREAIFNRVKDIPRFEKLATAYPLEAHVAAVHTESMKMPIIDDQVPVFGGLAAYSLILEYAIRVLEIPVDDLANSGVIMIRPKVEKKNGKDRILLPSVRGVDIWSHKFDDMPGDAYDAYVSLLPKYKHCADANFGNIWIYDSMHKRITVSSLDIGSKHIRFTSVQPTLYLLLAVGRVFDIPEYITVYLSLITLIKVVASRAPPPEEILNGPFFIPAKFYGADGQSETHEILLQQIRIDKFQESPFKLPSNYFPARGEPPRDFDYTTSKFFRKSGKKIYS